MDSGTIIDKHLIYLKMMGSSIRIYQSNCLQVWKIAYNLEGISRSQSWCQKYWVTPSIVPNISLQWECNRMPFGMGNIQSPKSGQIESQPLFDVVSTAGTWFMDNLINSMSILQNITRDKIPTKLATWWIWQSTINYKLRMSCTKLYKVKISVSILR